MKVFFLQSSRCQVQSEHYVVPRNTESNQCSNCIIAIGNGELVIEGFRGAESAGSLRPNWRASPGRTLITADVTTGVRAVSPLAAPDDGPANPARNASKAHARSGLPAPECSQVPNSLHWPSCGRVVHCSSTAGLSTAKKSPILKLSCLRLEPRTGSSFCYSNVSCYNNCCLGPIRG
ncbi:unnamed protein product [Nesidiocoris tenuis]|uniref:Uncharacterized protein n=1 Tax=Nesidiocoris tenuis TaxID=355587 RepID=A0A6H5GPS3_9HEMI|nr:unnamed protein product [Nesidiocoris tenuis]